MENLVTGVLIAFTKGYLICYVAVYAALGGYDAWRLLCGALVIAIGYCFEAVTAGVFLFVYKAVIIALALFASLEDCNARSFISAFLAFMIMALSSFGLAKIIGTLVPALSEAEGFLEQLSLVPICIVVLFVCKQKRNIMSGNNYIYAVEMVAVSGKIIRYKGYFDSGNTLWDGDLPVCIIGSKMSTELGLVPCGELAVATVAGVKLMPKTPLKIKVYWGANKNKIYNITAVISPQMDGRKYDMLLHNSMYSEV